MNTWIQSNKLRVVVLSMTTGLVLGGCADLITTDVRYAPFTGPMLQVKATVKNDGSVNAPASTTKLDIKPAGETTFTKTATAPTPALAVGQVHEFPITFIPPTDVPTPGSGQCIELRACADSDNVVQEGTNEGNNCKTNSICR